MTINRPENLERPIIQEAKLVDREGTIVFGDLKPDGATLVVEYDGMKTGDRVQAWGLTSPDNYDETQIVPDRAISLTFKVPKSYFFRKRSVIFQYFVYAADDNIIGISNAAYYEVMDSFPEPLPAPVIEEALPSTGSIIVADLPANGATLIVDYPTVDRGDSITTIFDPGSASGSGPYVETKVVAVPGAIVFKIPKDYLEALVAEGSRLIATYYSIVTKTGTPDSSRIQMYKLE